MLITLTLLCLVSVFMVMKRTLLRLVLFRFADAEKSYSLEKYFAPSSKRSEFLHYYNYNLPRN